MNKFKLLFIVVVLLFNVGATNCDNDDSRNKHHHKRNWDEQPVNPIPEPSAGVLFGLGSVGLAGYFHYKNRRRK